MTKQEKEYEIISKEFPKLNGSPKQIKYAKDIRHGILKDYFKNPKEYKLLRIKDMQTLVEASEVITYYKGHFNWSQKKAEYLGTAVICVFLLIITIWLVTSVANWFSNLFGG